MTREFIGFNTVSSQSNLAFSAHLLELLGGLGFECEVQSLTDGRGVNKHNLVARRADKNGGIDGGLLLSGHMDTVPFRADQQANLSPVQEGAVLYGRGACDMKGGIAAQLEAAARVAGVPLDAPLTMAFTCDEGVGCVGAKALIKSPLIRSRYAIIGEPTDLKPVRMHKGYCGALVTLTGKAAHSSAPARGKSALKAATRVLLELEALEAELAGQPYYGGPGYFDPDHATLNVGLLQAGVARNVIPEVCTFTIEFRPLPGQDVAALFAELEARVRRVGEAQGVAVGFEVVTRDFPMETPADSEVVRFLESLTGARAGAVAFSTEGKEFNQLGLASAILGPGSISLAHQENEHVPIDELGQAVELYSAAISHFCR